MKIAVVMRQVLDLVEPVEIDESGQLLDYGGATFIVNEADDHALEQALLLKEAVGGEIVVVAFDFGDVDNTLYAAVAKGADRVIKVPWDDEQVAPSPHVASAVLAGPIQAEGVDLVLVGSWAHDELDGSLAPELAQKLALPYVGVIRGVTPDANATAVQVFKEYPGAAKARLRVRLPAVIGVLAAERPPRYVPVSRIRSVMKSVTFEEQALDIPTILTGTAVQRLYLPAVGERAEMLAGSETEVAERIVAILQDKGLLS